MKLDRVAIGIKTFLRDATLFNAISGIRDTMPDAQMIIADDGEQTEQKDGIYADLRREGHKVIICDFDAGFGFKSNKIADALDRDFLLVGSDDFDFRPPFVREGIEKLLDVLENTDMDIASGRVHGPYEFNLEDRGDVIIEHRVETNLNPTPWFIQVDLTVNYSLIKRRVFEKIRWSGAKINSGEHGSFFIDVKRANFKVAFVPNVEIREQRGHQGDERYRSYRGRFGATRSCFDERGIRKYVLGSGQVDYEKK